MKVNFIRRVHSILQRDFNSKIQETLWFLVNPKSLASRVDMAVTVFAKNSGIWFWIGRIVSKSRALKRQGRSEFSFSHSSPTSQMELIEKLLTAREALEVSHSEASSALREVFFIKNNQSTWKSSDLFRLASRCELAGLFTNALEIRKAGYDLFEEGLSSLPEYRRRVGLMLVAIQKGDKELARDSAQGLDLHLVRRIDKISDLLEYTRIWVSDSGSEFRTRNPSSSVDQIQNSLVSNREALVFGPGPAAIQDSPTYPGIVARTLSPTSARSASVGEIGPFETHIAYLNKQTERWLGLLPPEEVERVFYRFKVVVTYGRRDLTFPGPSHYPIRRARRPNGFLSGKPNSGQIMICDLLAMGAARVFVQGMTFFLGPETYRSDQRRFDLERGGTADSHGRVGSPLPFQTCRGIGAHGTGENWRLIRNLWETGRVNGDRYFVDAISLSEDQYAKNLETKFGFDAV